MNIINNKIIIENLLGDISKGIDYEYFIKKYFVNHELILSNKDLNKLYTNKLEKLDLSLKESTYEIIPYNKFSKEGIQLNQELDNNENITLLWFDKLQELHYIKFKGDSIYSMIPITQGNKIIGWF